MKLDRRVLGRLSPMPSNDLSGCLARRLSMQSITLLMPRSGFERSGSVSRERNRPLRSITAIIAWSGRISAARITISPFNESNVGLRPRGRRAAAPSVIHASSRSCSTIEETVLGCSPEQRDRSARAIGCFVRMSSRTTSRLISRATSLDASSTYARSIRLMPCLLRARSIWVFIILFA